MHTLGGNLDTRIARKIEYFQINYGLLNAKYVWSAALKFRAGKYEINFIRCILEEYSFN